MPTHNKPNAEILSFAAKRGFIHEAAKQKRTTNLRLTFLEAKGLGIYGIKLRHGEHGER